MKFVIVRALRTWGRVYWKARRRHIAKDTDFTFCGLEYEQRVLSGPVSRKLPLCTNCEKRAT